MDNEWNMYSVNATIAFDKEFWVRARSEQEAAEVVKKVYKKGVVNSEITVCDPEVDVYNTKCEYTSVPQEGIVSYGIYYDVDAEKILED